MKINTEQWALLSEAEEQMYDGEHGAHAYTSVMEHDDGEGHDHLAAMWAQVKSHGGDDLDRMSAHRADAEIARRVATAQAILVFGVEYGTSLGMKAERAAQAPNSQEEA